MAKFNMFEEIKAWQIARGLVETIYGLTKQKDFAKDYGLRDQIQKAAVSAMSNIAEGFERYNNREFIQFLNIARGSVAEVRSQLYIAFDLRYITEKEFLSTKEQCESLSRHIWNLMQYLRNNLKSKS